MYGDQFGEFVCGYWGLKGQRTSGYKKYIFLLLCFTINLQGPVTWG